MWFIQPPRSKVYEDKGHVHIGKARERFHANAHRRYKGHVHIGKARERFHANAHRRLSHDVIDDIHSAVRRVRSDPSASRSVLITTATGKFFSNGYDIDQAKSHPHLVPVMDAKLRSLFADLISLPMPTIAAVTGHSSAAGFLLVMSHDYVLMRRDRGFLYMSELDIGLTIPAWLMALVRLKIGSPAARRDVVLTAAKLTAVEAAEKGIVDSVHDSASETVEAAVRLGEDLVRRGWDGHVYSRMREILLKEVLDAIVSDEAPSPMLVINRSKL
ncbi:PREDICTED: enoyl-CoA delta isomerase 1, peroxisomal-like [Tarenaya hassleriana]|uniref:enoyl-CoA delta isomerase 1, peroxisomal-like n=1 Tax=Tarenaya hassleriana TaxID=28532 RepID=UPI00053C39BF|nr:PREDICTED: enoyl-CoA delta isomerase 1, peroxisomal-like [Tarenaya hassleriana]